ncbi:MAG: bifunctional oligoribonuclease/PAP phosphatase NrnA [Bacteroidota bacterium]
MEPTDFSRLSELLKMPCRIAVVTHSNPDGDAIGSSLAMTHYLKHKGHDARTVVPDDFPEFLKWMPAAGDILIFDNDVKNAERFLLDADLVFCLDFNAPDRVQAMTKTLEQAKGIKILIDHHLDVVHFCDFELSNAATSSTSELVYDFIVNMGDENLLDKNIAEALFVGIVTDTGSFSYACNYEHTFSVVANLMRLGIDAEHIHRLVYDTWSESRIKLLGFCLNEKLTVISNYSTSYIVLSKADLERFNHKIGDTEGVVNYALSIKNVKLAALITERDDFVKISFRSKGTFNVNDFARLHFNGGGHKNASGANVYLPLGEAVKKFVSLLASYSKELMPAHHEV